MRGRGRRRRFGRVGEEREDSFERVGEEREDKSMRLVVFHIFLLGLFPERRGMSGADAMERVLARVGMESRHLLPL
jgi:hypothetical protein